MLTAAQTDDKQKHQLLARTLAERLNAKPEGLRAMATKMALDALGYMTPSQIRILGLTADLLYVGPTATLSGPQFKGWLENRFAPYGNLAFTHLDLLHLESLSCLKVTAFLSRDLNAILTEKSKNAFEPSMLDTQLGQHLKALWGQGLMGVDLTTVGQLVGIYVSDLLTGGSTTFTGWD
jgi:hypothetical protein